MAKPETKKYVVRKGDGVWVLGDHYRLNQRLDLLEAQARAFVRDGSIAEVETSAERSNQKPSSTTSSTPAPTPKADKRD